MLRRVRPALVATLTAAAWLAVPGPVAAERANPLYGAKSWAFQLQNLDPEEQAKIAASPYDLVVIDYARGKSIPEIPLKCEEVERMKKKPDGGRRLVIAYMSIGETENYRFYWQNDWHRHRPDWMGGENKDWKGNFLAKYWLPVWQNIVYGSPQAFTDRILKECFDGFYLDRVDAYYYYGDTHEKRAQMVDFVKKVSAHLRKTKPDVAIIAQNAEELADFPDYLAAIDGIAKESLLYGVKGLDKLNPRDDIEPSSALLKKAQKAGKVIFGIEYLKNRANIDFARQRFKELGFVLYIGQRGLGTLAGVGSDGYPTFPRTEEDPVPTKAAARKK